MPILAPIGSHPSARQLPTSPPLPSALPYARDIRFTSVRSCHVPTTFGRPGNRCNREKTPPSLIPAQIGSHPSTRPLHVPPPHPPTSMALVHSPSTPCIVLHACRPFLPPRSRPIDHDRLVRHGRKFRCTVRSPSYLHELLEYLTNSNVLAVF